MEDLYCSICKSVPKFPLILPCCLKSICKDHKSPRCPFCDQDLESQTLALNTILIHFFNSQISSKCDRCESTASTISCHNCQTSLCKDCSNFIHSDGIYSRHVLSNCSQLMNTVDNIDICHSHKLPLKFFCPSDKVCLCRRCKEGHNLHSPVGIEEVFNGKISEINMKVEQFDKTLNEVKGQSNKCKSFLEDLTDCYDLSRSVIEKKFLLLKQAVQWKEEEVLREIEVVYRRKKIEVEYLFEPLMKTCDKLQDIIKFLNVLKNLSPSLILTQDSYIKHLITQAEDCEIPAVKLSRTLFPIKFEVQAIINCIESMSISDETLSVNTSVLNQSSMRSTLNSFSNILSQTPQHSQHTQNPANGNLSMIKSPQLRSKTIEKSTTPVKSRSNSRESIIQNLDENPLEPRLFKRKLQSATAIQVSWTHPCRPVQGLSYSLEYGVGMKLNNIEQFRQVYKGTAHTCIITDLLPKTSYRFRVAAALNEVPGDWSEIVTVTTLDYQRVDPASFAAHANLVSRANEKFVQFDKPGMVTAVNPYTFGKYVWEVKIFNNTLYPNEGNLLKIGVCGGKGKVVFGIDVEYQGFKGNFKVKVRLDVEAKVLSLVNGASGSSDSVYSLPDGPLYPAVQYKPSKTSTAPVRISLDFDVD